MSQRRGEPWQKHRNFECGEYPIRDDPATPAACSAIAQDRARARRRGVRARRQFRFASPHAWYERAMPQMTAEELDRFIVEQFPQGRSSWRIARLEDGEIDLHLPFREEALRPGGTISGPTLMALADTAAYLLILSMIGPVALAVTTSLNINFMRRPKPEELIARARMLKLGRQLAVVEVLIYLLSSDDLVAQASVTYSIPPDRAT